MPSRMFAAGLATGLLFTSALPAAEPKYSASDYFPLEYYNLWECYAHEEGKQEPHDIDVREKVEENGKVLYRVILTSKYSPAEDPQYFETNDRGLFLHKEVQGDVSPPIHMLPNPIKLGWKWEKDVTIDGKQAHVACEVGEELETVELREGSTKAVRLKYAYKTADKEKVTTYWLAKGVGPVKMDVNDNGRHIVYDNFEFTDAKERREQDRSLQEFLDDF